MTSSEIEPEALAAYLLGRMSEAERDALEERLFGDEGGDLFARLEAAETDLLDDYEQGELDADDRRAFEELLLASPELARRRRLVRLVARSASSSSPSRARSRVWLELAAGVALASLAALAATRAGRAEREAARLGRELDSARIHRAIPPSPAAPPAITAFLLREGALRGGGGANEVALDGKSPVVILRLPVEPGEARVYAATVGEPGRAAVVDQSGLRAATDQTGAFVVVTIPREVLPPGDYLVRLFLAGKVAREPVASYAIRVTRSGTPGP